MKPKVKAQAKPTVKPKTKPLKKSQPQSIIPKKDVRAEIDANKRTEKRSPQMHEDIPQAATPQSDYIAPSNRNRAALTDTPEPQASRIPSAHGSVAILRPPAFGFTACSAVRNGLPSRSKESFGEKVV